MASRVPVSFGLLPGLDRMYRTITSWVWILSGVFAFLGLCGLSALHEERERDAPLRYRSSLWFALATLTRPEGGLFALAAGLGLLVDVLRRRLRLSSLVVWTLPFALIVGTHTLWRHSYYGYWLPNTFYAKVGGLWWDQGLHYLGLIQQHYLLAWLLPLLLLGLVRRPRFTPLVMAVLLLLFTAYILFTTNFEPDTGWGDTVGAEQLRATTVRLGGMLLLMGILHGANVLSLPIVGRLLGLSRRMEEDTGQPEAA